MAFDGLFLHYFLKENQDFLQKTHIKSLYLINKTTFNLVLENKRQLLLVLHPASPYLCFHNDSFNQINAPLNEFLKKRISGSYIKEAVQHENDRIVTFTCIKKDELGYFNTYHLIFELTGRSSNFIMTDVNNVILTALKRSYLEDKRLIQQHAPYLYPCPNAVNPFKTNEQLIKYLGVSSYVQNEINTYGLKNVLARKTQPTLIENEKTIYYCFDLLAIKGKRTFFSSLSDLINHYQTLKAKEDFISADKANIRHFVGKNLNKAKNKLLKQQEELNKARENQTLKTKADLLQANIDNIPQHQKEVTLIEPETKEKITISLNQMLSIRANINLYYEKYKKNKRAINILNEIIKQTETEIIYFTTIIEQLKYAEGRDLNEIKTELNLTPNKKQNKKQTKIQLTHFLLENNDVIIVGKNNLQNNYLTHTLANKCDYFFHLKDMPGAHVILKGEITDKNILLAGNIAAIYSGKDSSNKITVDYTEVKWVKKVKGKPGSFVIYNHEKSITILPDINLIKALTIKKM